MGQMMGTSFSQVFNHESVTLPRPSRTLQAIGHPSLLPFTPFPTSQWHYNYLREQSPLGNGTLPPQDNVLTDLGRP